MSRVVAIGMVLVALVAACGGVDDGDELAVGAELAMEDERLDRFSGRRGRPSLTIVSPEEGAIVTSPVKVEVEVENLTLTKPGQTVDGQGGLHVLIRQPCLAPGFQFLPGENTIFVEDGSSEVELDLPPGRHNLCVQVGDGFHVAIAVFDTVRINVINSQ